MTHTNTEQPEALRLAHALSGGKLIDDSTEWADTLHAAAAELRHQHARIVEMEEKLAAIGAIGAIGVEPMRKQAVRRAPAAPVPQGDGKINPADFNVETFRRSGNGGLVKPDNCVRITHVPTGLFEEGVSERSIHTNKAEAWERLSARLEALADAHPRA